MDGAAAFCRIRGDESCTGETGKGKTGRDRRGARCLHKSGETCEEKRPCLKWREPGPGGNRWIKNSKRSPVFAERLGSEPGSHAFDHTLRVARLCELIGRSEGADPGILIPAALLHDIARPAEKARGVPHEIEGARVAEEYLGSIGYDPALIPAIAAAIRTHRFRSDEKPATPEAKILSDADKLDAMGAVGIARTFMRAGEHGGEMQDAVDHFHEKLLRLPDLLYTATAREIAADRHRFLTGFLRELEDETRDVR